MQAAGLQPIFQQVPAKLWESANAIFRRNVEILQNKSSRQVTRLNGSGDTGGTGSRHATGAVQAFRQFSNLPESTIYSGPQAAAAKRVTLRTIQEKYAGGEALSMVTAYDYPSAVHVRHDLPPPPLRPFPPIPSLVPVLLPLSFKALFRLNGPLLGTLPAPLYVRHDLSSVDAAGRGLSKPNMHSYPVYQDIGSGYMDL